MGAATAMMNTHGVQIGQAAGGSLGRDIDNAIHDIGHFFGLNYPHASDR